MKYFVFIIFVLGSDCIAQTKVEIFPCKQLEPSIEIWNHTGSEYLIEKLENKRDHYEQSFLGWDLNDYPYPKKFDVKVNLQNNYLAYEQEKKSQELDPWILSISMRLKVSQSPNALYPLNSKIVENVDIIKDKLITNEDFKNKPINVNHFLEIWKKDLTFEYYYNKYKSKNLYITQLIFEIKLFNGKRKSLCSYEYIFNMNEHGEP